MLSFGLLGYYAAACGGRLADVHREGAGGGGGLYAVEQDGEPSGRGAFSLGKAAAVERDDQLSFLSGFEFGRLAAEPEPGRQESGGGPDFQGAASAVHAGNGFGAQALCTGVAEGDALAAQA